MITDVDFKVIKVLIGQVSLTRAPNRLQSVLGSCIGLVLYDPVANLAGLAHVLLPCSEGRPPGSLPGKYADRAIPCLYEAMLQRGGMPNRLKAKIAGGARMFSNSVNYKVGDVGKCNIEAIRDGLQKLHIPVVSSDVGGEAGRKVEFDPQSARLTVEIFGKAPQVI